MTIIYKSEHYGEKAYMSQIGRHIANVAGDDALENSLCRAARVGKFLSFSDFLRIRDL